MAKKKTKAKALYDSKAAEARAEKTTAKVNAYEEKAEERIAKAGTKVLGELQQSVARYKKYAKIVLKDVFAGTRKKPELADVLKVGDDLRNALLDAGLNDVARTLTRELKGMHEAAAEQFKSFDRTPTKSGMDVETLNALVELKKAEFLDLADQRLVTPVRTATMDGMIGNRDRLDVYDEISKFIDTQGITTRGGKEWTDSQIETLIDDGMRRQLRQAKAQQAEDFDLKIIWYQGPDDKVTSEQCRFMVRYNKHGAPGMWLVEEFTAPNINRLMKDKLLKENPLIVGGHFNCRHTVTYVPYRFAVEKGWTTPKMKDDLVSESYG